MNIKKILIIIIGLLMGITNAFARFGADKSNSLFRLLPPSNWKNGWKYDKEPHSYSATDLYEYIDGSADLYIAYGFKELVTVSFVTTAEQYVTIDIYDLGNPLNAFGVFSNYRIPDNNYVDIGTEAVISDYNIRFYHGTYIVDVNASEASEPVAQFMRQAAAEVAARINLPAQEPKELTLLPAIDLIAKTPKYVSRGLLGQQFFPPGLEAKYKLNDKEVTVFIALGGSETNAQKAFQAYQEYIQTQGERFKEMKIDNQVTITGKIPYHDFTIAFQSGQLVIGIVDLPTGEQGHELITLLNRHAQSVNH
jgi:hypothetical protein